MDGVKKYRFMIGDSVVCVSRFPDDNHNLDTGMTGVVVCYGDNSHRIGVKWDESVCGHTLGGRCEDGHGWYVDDCDIDFLHDETIGRDIDETSLYELISAK